MIVLYYLLLHLLVYNTVCSEMVCDSDEVKCVKYPETCSSPTDCDYILKYQPASTDSTKIEISGQPDKYYLSSFIDDMWLAFCFSPLDRGMSDMTIYACQRVGGTDYTVRRLPGYNYGVVNSASKIVAKEGTLTGKYQDGVMTCTYEILNRHLPSASQKMAYSCAGPMGGENNMLKHRRIPKRTAFSLKLQQGDEENCQLNKKKLKKEKKSYKKKCLNKGFASSIGCDSKKKKKMTRSQKKKCKKIEESLKACDYSC